MQNRLSNLALVTALVFVLAGCMEGPASISKQQEPSASNPSTGTSIQGKVSFDSRATQTTIAEAGTRATVSVIEASTNHTVAATITDANGVFNLTFSASFSPTPNTPYYMEAIKGLGNNLPGNGTVRVRTLVSYKDGTWSSILGANHIVSAGTTALCIGAALKGTTEQGVDYASLIGKLDILGDYTPVQNLTSEDYTTLLGLVRQALAENRDPVAVVTLSPSNSWAIAP